MDLTPQQRRAATLAALLGNALEWFDIASYGYVATPLGHAFFPAEDPGLQALAAFGVFAVGYLMRPVGSLVLGPIGDLLGRPQPVDCPVADSCPVGCGGWAGPAGPTHGARVFGGW
jgi:MHS family proline/betaine transporter-like MFS transporter